MNIYLLRHGVAVPREGRAYRNDDRPLTAEGLKKAKKAAKGIASLVENFDAIFSSSLIRAHDTAKITAAAVGCEKILRTSPFLLPDGSMTKLLELLKRQAKLEKVLLVGHEPDLSVLGSKLLKIPEGSLELKKGSLCCIQIEGIPGKDRGRLKWLLTSKQLEAIG